VTSFNKNPLINPTRDPIAAFSAAFLRVGLLINSPKKAPPNDPIMMPKGPSVISPNTRPMVDPMAPFRVPPNFFVPIIGTM
jgi:hypothetical protein